MTTPTPAPAPQPAPPPAVLTPTAPTIAERAAVNVQIRSLATASGLPQAWTDSQIDAGASLDEARAAALAAMQSRTAPALQVRTAVGVDHADPEDHTRAMAEALHMRHAPTHTPSSDLVRHYAGLSTVEYARTCLRQRNLPTGGAPDAVITRALQSTGDFPLILGDTVNRTLRESYAAAPAPLKRLGRQTTARDFRAKHRLQFSSAPSLEPVNEHGEFKSGSMAEAGESYRLDTAGLIVGVTRQAMVNDDLGALSDMSRRLGTTSSQSEAKRLTALLLSNPVMSDGQPLFSAAHRNLAAAGTGITQEALSAARKAMRLQAGLQGELVSVTPKYLLVGADRETEAEKAITAVQATKIGDSNAFAFLSVVVDPRITDGSWHLVADTAEVDGLEYAYLEGEAGPQITSEVGFTVDGIRWRVRLDFGAGFVDHRGWYRNPGN